MKIDMTNWANFIVDDLFEIINGKGITVEEIESNPGDFEAVQSGESDNGVMGYISKAYCRNKGYSYCEEACLTVARSGTSGYVSFHENGCVVGDSAKILLLKKREAKSKQTYLFLQTLLAANRFKYTYGRKVTEALYSNTVIKLPVTTSGEPDWQWMESYIDSLHSKPLTTGNDPKDSTYNLDISTWKTFLYSEIFDIRKGFYNKKPDHTELGNIPFLGAIAGNNGVTEYYTYNEIATATKTGDAPNSPIEQKLFPPNAVCVTNNGSVGYAYFQPTRFTCSHDVNPLYRKDGEFNAFTGQFVATVIMHDRYRWDYGRKWRPVRMINSTIKLPATPEGKPDWQYMENYIKSLPYGDRL